jgi:hypothetical protein
VVAVSALVIGHWLIGLCFGRGASVWCMMLVSAVVTIECFATSIALTLQLQQGLILGVGILAVLQIGYLYAAFGSEDERRFSTSPT